MKTDILFWSGGKDSWLALEYYRRDYSDEQHRLELLTTYDEEREYLPFQNLSLKTIREQANQLDLDLIPIGLPPECPNEIYLEHIVKQLETREPPVERLVFGDWQNEEIRNWREEQFNNRGYSCLFPIWQKSLHELLPVIQLNPVEIRISSVDREYETYIRQGEPYNQALIRTLPSFIDPMGENGEFHTRVIIHDLKDQVV